MTTTSISSTPVPDVGWWSGNTRLVNLSGKLQRRPCSSCWFNSFVGRCHLNATLGIGVGTGGAVVDTYPYFVIAVIHLISSAVLGAGGLFHSLMGQEVLPKNSTLSGFFGYDWKDKHIPDYYSWYSLGSVRYRRLVISCESDVLGWII